MPILNPAPPAGPSLLLISTAVTLTLLFAFVAVGEHKPWAWLMALSTLILVVGLIKQARKHPRKEIEIETLDL